VKYWPNFKLYLCHALDSKRRGYSDAFEGMAEREKRVRMPLRT
jgi:hypothetical protein